MGTATARPLDLVGKGNSGESRSDDGRSDAFARSETDSILDVRVAAVIAFAPLSVRHRTGRPETAIREGSTKHVSDYLRTL